MGREKGRENKKQESPMAALQKTLLKILVIITLLYIMFGWVAGVMTAPNNDMFPRIDAGDLVLYYRLGRDIKAQDIVVIRKNKTTYIGRVIASGGDTVNITEEEKLKINGDVAIENKIFYPTPIYEGFVDYPVKLKEGEYFILSDSRDGGEDSRYYGVVKREDIKGLVITILRRNNL